MSSISAAESPGGVPAELRRIQAIVSDLQERFKAAALAHGYGHGMIEPAWVPFVSLYVTTWIPIVLRWQAFYQANKDWAGHPYQWTRQAELDRILRDAEEVRAQAEAIAPTDRPLGDPGDPGDPGADPRDPVRATPATIPPRDAMGTALAVVAVASGALILLALAGGRGR